MISDVKCLPEDKPIMSNSLWVMQTIRMHEPSQRHLQKHTARKGNKQGNIYIERQSSTQVAALNADWRHRNRSMTWHEWLSSSAVLRSIHLWWLDRVSDDPFRQWSNSTQVFFIVPGVCWDPWRVRSLRSHACTLCLCSPQHIITVYRRMRLVLGFITLLSSATLYVGLYICLYIYVYICMYNCIYIYSSMHIHNYSWRETVYVTLIAFTLYRAPILLPILRGRN